MIFGQRLKQLRKQKELTLRELESSIGVSFSTLSKYERSEYEPDLKTITKLADFFDVSTDYLMGRTDDPNFYFDKDEAKKAAERKVFKNDASGLTFDGQPLTDEEAEYIKRQLLIYRDLLDKK